MLVDSRTGITDIGGICTIHLPDVVIALFTSNEQSLTGVVKVMRDARREHAALPVDRSRLLVLPLPARDESQAEHERSEKWYARFATELDEFYRDWLPARVTPADALDVLRVPYKAYWSFGEPLPVIEEGTSRPTSLGYAYALVASLIESGFDWSRMKAGRYGVDRVVPQVSAPKAPSRALRIVLLALASVIPIAVLALVFLRPTHRPVATDAGDVQYGDPYTAAGDAGARATPEERTRIALLDAAGRTQVPLQRLLLLREIPASVFPVAEVKELLKGVVVPEAVFRSDTSDGYIDARFDHLGQRLVLARRSGAFVVAASGRGGRIAVLATPPVSLAAFSADDNLAIDEDQSGVMTADGAGVTIWDAAGVQTGAIQYFADHPARFVAIAEGDDGVHTFLLGGPGGSAGTRNAVFAVDAGRGGSVERWWDALKPLRAIDFHGGRLWYVTPDGAVYAMQRPKQPELVIPSPAPIDAAALGRGYVALARGNQVIARSLDPKGLYSAEITVTKLAPSNPIPGPVFASIAVGDNYLAAAVGSAVEIARLTTLILRTANDSVRLTAGGDAAMVATAGDWLLVGSTQGSVELWRFGDSSYHAVLHRADDFATGQRSPLQRIAFSPEGGRVLAVWRDGTVRVWAVRASGVVDGVPDAEVLPRLHAATSACLEVEDRLLLLRAESAAQARAANDACLAAAAAPGATAAGATAPSAPAPPR